MKIYIPGLAEMYVDKEMTTTEISKISGFSVSTVRSRLVDLGLIRSLKESQLIAAKKGRKSKHAGRKRVFSDETKKKMSQAKLAWASKNAKGVSLKPNGYKEFTRGENKSKSIHRVIMEDHLGRKLNHKEIVHHKDENKQNNNIENLMVMTRSEHARHHSVENNSKRSRRPNGTYN